MARLSNLLGVREVAQDGNSMELPPPQEFPKMVYRATAKHPKGYVTKIVNSKAEEDALPKGWLKTRAEIHALLDPIHQAEHAKPEDSEDYFTEEAKAEPEAAKPKAAKPKAASGY